MHQSGASSEASENQILWNDFLRNSSLPVVDGAFEETQEGETAGISSQSVATSSSSEQRDECQTGEISANDNSRGDSISVDLHDAILDDASTDDEIAAGNDFAESIGHVTDMSAIIRTKTSLSELEDYDHLFDPVNQLKIESNDDISALVSATQNDLIIMPEQIIGHTHLRDIEIKKGRDRKRTKVDTKRSRANSWLHEFGYFDDYVVGSSF